MHKHLLKISRLEGLTDGVFAIAMTILVLGLQVPEQGASTHLNNVVIQDILFRISIYIGSFVILGTLWVAMIFQISVLDRLNRPYLWTHIIYLMMICVVPFSASLLASYPKDQISIMFYGINLLFASSCQFLIYKTSIYFKLNKELYSPIMRRAVVRRIFLAPCFYLAALVISNWSIPLAFLTLIAPTLAYIFPGRIDKYEEYIA